MIPSVEVVIPVYNEEDALPVSIPKLCAFLRENLSNPWRVTIADNASIDGTRTVSEDLCQEIEEVNYLYLPEKGRGRALKAAWLGSECDIVSYMDVDLSTDLSHFPELVGELEDGCHVAIGSRLSRGSKVTQRSFKREFTSRTYNKLIWSMFFVGFPDAQCGFKAMTRQAAQAIIPNVENNNWFFDTELLIIAEKRGYRIGVVPVAWEDDPSSTVNVVKTATEDIKGLLRLRFGGIPKIQPPNQ